MDDLQEGMEVTVIGGEVGHALLSGARATVTDTDPDIDHFEAPVEVRLTDLFETPETMYFEPYELKPTPDHGPSR